MIQLVIRLSKFCFLLIITLFFSGCKFEVEGPNLFNHVAGSGKVISEPREVVKNFDKIQVSSSIDVELEQAPNFEVVVRADDNIISYIVTEFSGNTLKIYYDNVSVKNIKEAKVYVKMPNISALRASSSSEIEAKGIIKSDDLILKTSSTGEITLFEVHSTSLTMEASSSSDIKIERVYTIDFNAQASSTAEIDIEYIESDKIKLSASSSSDIELKGKALDLEATTSSTGKIDAKELLVNNIIAASSSSSTIDVYPITSLKAKASSASDIYYYNEPQSIEKNTSSSGSVKRKK